MKAAWNETKRIAALNPVALLLLLMSACTPPPIVAGQRYYLGYVNKSGRVLEDVRVYYGNIQIGGTGDLVKGGTATEGIITLPIPAEAEIRWIDKGITNAVKVPLQRTVPKRLTSAWTLHFVFNQNGSVHAKAIKDNDNAAKAELWKGLRPDGEYRLGFVNKTGHDIVEVSAYHGEQRLGGAKSIPLRVRQWYSDPLLPPVPSEAEVRWKTDGAVHSAKASWESVPKGFEGIIYLVMKADNTVEVFPIKKGDDQGAFKVVK